MNLLPVPPSPAGVADNNTTGNDSTPAPETISLVPVPPPRVSEEDNNMTGPLKSTARSCLYEICAQSHWKPPVFDCCNEQGPSNHRSFTFKVGIEMKEGSNSKLVVECIGKPQFSKKSAADSAAEGILWYLVHLGYPKKPNRYKKSR